MQFDQLHYLLEIQCNWRRTNITVDLFNNLSFLFIQKQSIEGFITNLNEVGNRRYLYLI